MVGLAACTQDADGPHEHAFGAWETVIAATCTEAGEEERVCTECGAKETVAVAPLGHDVAEGLCALCGETFGSLEGVTKCHLCNVPTERFIEF